MSSHFYQNHGKRWVDFFLALVVLLLLGVPMLLVGLVVLLVDGPPLLFCQKRVGRMGKLFTMYKYRTMRRCTEPGTSITVAGDSRVTSLGKILRRLKIDELPQLINVMTGDMSLVGPRPDVPGYADALQGEARSILLLRPGITGPATLAFRNEEELLARALDPKKYNDEVIFPEKVRLNLEYAKRMTFSQDFQIILKTCFGDGRFGSPASSPALPSNSVHLQARFRK